MKYGELFPECEGGQHVIPVPPGMTPDDAWAEMCTFGELLNWSDDCEWHTIRCDGGTDCPCLNLELEDEFTFKYNGELIYDHATGFVAIGWKLDPVVGLYELCMFLSPEGHHVTLDDPDGDPWGLHVCGLPRGHTDVPHRCAADVCPCPPWEWES